MNARHVVALLACCACSYEPQRVFVPGEGFEHTVEVSTGQGATPTVRVGEELVLHARRVTGPWQEVARASLPPDACWVTGLTDPEEPEVADNVRWLVGPEGFARFNLGLRGDRTRTVQFSRPGRYELRAESKTWCGPPKLSDTLTILVAE